MSGECGGNVTEIYSGDGVTLIQPVGGTFFSPVYAKAIRDQFATQVSHLPEDKRPTLIVFEDPNGEKMAAKPAVEEKPRRYSSDLGSWIKFGSGDVHVYHDGPTRSIVIGHNEDYRGKLKFPLAILMHDGGDVSLQVPSKSGGFPEAIPIDPQQFAGRLLDFLNSFVPSDADGCSDPIPEAAPTE